MNRHFKEATEDVVLELNDSNESRYTNEVSETFGEELAERHLENIRKVIKEFLEQNTDRK